MIARRLPALLAVTAAGLLAACRSAMTVAVVRDDLQSLREQIAAGADIEKTDPNGETPLMVAALAGRVDAVNLLLDAGADPNRKVLFGTPLGHAVLGGNAAIAEILIARGAKSTPDAEKLIAKSSSRRDRAVATPTQAPPRHYAAETRRSSFSDVDSPRATGASRPDDFALVVGIEGYQSLPKADYGERDALTVRKHLEALGFPARNIVSLTGSQATGNKLKSYLEEWLPLNVKPESTLFVYYSGHGAPDPKTGEAYLVPWDGDPSFLKSTAYPLKKLYADLGKIKARRVLVALDACFSGAGGRSVLAQGARPLVAKVADAAPASGAITVLAAASGDEITGSLPEQGHGMFTYFLLKGLAEGKRSAAELHGYLSPKVQDEARRQNRTQTPVRLGEGSL